MRPDISLYVLIPSLRRESKAADKSPIPDSHPCNQGGGDQSRYSILPSAFNHYLASWRFSRLGDHGYRILIAELPLCVSFNIDKSKFDQGGTIRRMTTMTQEHTGTTGQDHSNF